MKTVQQVSRLTGVSVRTLHHYDAIGLLPPTQVTEAGYRLYDAAALEQLQLILLLRELEFPLKEITAILSASEQERNRILDDRIKILQKRRDRLKTITFLAQQIRQTGVAQLDMKQFDIRSVEDHAVQAKALWGNTDAYREFEEKQNSRSNQQSQSINDGLMDLFRNLGELKDCDPGCEEAQAWVQQLQSYITAHYYNCTAQILRGLGCMYAAGDSFTENIDAAGGSGTADFANQAIQIYCSK